MLKPFDVETGKPKKESDYTKAEKEDYRNRMEVDKTQKAARAKK